MLLVTHIERDPVAVNDETFSVTCRATGGTERDLWQTQAGRRRVSVTIIDSLPGPVTGFELSVEGDRVRVSWQPPQSGFQAKAYIVHLRPEGRTVGSGRTKSPEGGQADLRRVRQPGAGPDLQRLGQSAGPDQNHWARV